MSHCWRCKACRGAWSDEGDRNVCPRCDRSFCNPCWHKYRIMDGEDTDEYSGCKMCEPGVRQKFRKSEMLDWIRERHGIDPADVKAAMRAEGIMEADSEHGWNWGMVHSIVEAARLGDARLVRALIESHADVDALGDMTPLMAASCRGHEDIVEMLLENGAEVDYGDEDGETALTTAIRSDKAAVAAILLRRGATIPDGMPLILSDTVHRAIVPILTMPHARFILGVYKEAASAIGLLQGFPEIIRFIVSHSLPGWFDPLKDFDLP